MSVKNGGQAFPNTQCQPVEDPQDNSRVLSGWHASPGMTLRQWYAGQALQGELACQTEAWDWSEGKENFLAERCFKLADAMIAFEENEGK